MSDSTADLGRLYKLVQNEAEALKTLREDAEASIQRLVALEQNIGQMAVKGLRQTAQEFATSLNRASSSAARDAVVGVSTSLDESADHILRASQSAKASAAGIQQALTHTKGWIIAGIFLLGVVLGMGLMSWGIGFDVRTIKDIVNTHTQDLSVIYQNEYHPSKIRR